MLKTRSGKLIAYSSQALQPVSQSGAVARTLSCSLLLTRVESAWGKRCLPALSTQTLMLDATWTRATCRSSAKPASIKSSAGTRRKITRSGTEQTSFRTLLTLALLTWNRGSRKQSQPLTMIFQGQIRQTCVSSRSWSFSPLKTEFCQTICGYEIITNLL